MDGLDPTHEVLLKLSWMDCMILLVDELYG